MKQIKGEIRLIPTADITPYEGSHNTDAVIEMLKESITNFGIAQPICVDKNNVVVTGNAVFKAAKALGIAEIPCVVLDDLTDNEIAEYRIADNKTSEFAKWNEKKLKKELSYLDDAGALQPFFDENIYKMLGMTPEAPAAPAPAPTSSSSSAPASPSQPSAPAVGQPKGVDAEVQVVNRPTPEENERFRDALKSTEESMVVSPTEYFEFECSRCHKVVRVKMQ